MAVKGSGRRSGGGTFNRTTKEVDYSGTTSPGLGMTGGTYVPKSTSSNSLVGKRIGGALAQGYDQMGIPATTVTSSPSYLAAGSSPTNYIRPSVQSTSGNQQASTDAAQNATAGIQAGAWNPSNINAYQNPNPILAPTMTSIGDAYSTIKGLGILPEYTPTTFNQIATPENINAQTVSGLDQSYWDNLLNQSQKRLEQSYFSNNDSLANRLTQQMNARGLIGSGVEAGGTTDLYKNYGNDLVNANTDITGQQAQANLDINKFNAQNQYAADVQNRQNLLDINKYNTTGQYNADYANQQLKNTLAQLGLAAAGDQARTSNEFNTKMFGSQVDLEKQKADQISSAVEQLSNVARDTNATDADRRAAMAALFNYYRGIGVQLPYSV